MFNVIEFLNNNNISYRREGKNTSVGWVNISCPMCDDKSNHGGFNTRTGHYNCWKCGWHSTQEIISSLLDISQKEASEIEKEYSVSASIRQIMNDGEEKKISSSEKSLTLPSEFKNLLEMHKRYLSDRNFNPDMLERKYRLLGTGFAGKYKFRIIVPVFYKGKIVSYQGRDVSGQSQTRYKACPRNEELIHHKDLFYNLDNVRNRRAIIVEGVFDVWRLGDGAIATFGISTSLRQVVVAKKHLDYAAILFDNEPAAVMSAETFGNRLNAIGIKVDMIQINHNYKDPSEMPQDVADKFMKEVLS